MRISDWSSDVCSSDLPKWLIGQFAGLADPAAQLVWRAGRSAKNAKSPGIRYCGRERRNTCPTHSGQKDRVFDPENFANAALECHRVTLCILRNPPAPVFLRLPPPDLLGYKLGASLCEVGGGARHETSHHLDRKRVSQGTR